MDNLLEGMKCLELGSFDGEWSEHEILEEWMMNAYEHGGRLDEDDAQMKDVEDEDKSIAKNDEEKLEVNNTSMEFKYNYEQYEGNYEAWLTNELLAMDVDGDTRELIQRKTTFLNISSEAYYGGGTWFVDR